MTEQQFIKTYQSSWTQLAQLLDKKHLSSSELLLLNELYRGASAQLSQAQTHYADSTLYNQLLPLVARAHNQIYQRERTSFIRGLKKTYQQVPAMLGRHKGIILTAGLLLYGGALLAFMLSWLQPDMVTLFVPPEYLTIDYRRFDHRDWSTAVASSLIMTNNIRVTFNVFALGLTGLGTPYILLANGFMLGGVFELATRQNASAAMLAWLLPHGILELTAIVYGAAAGFLLLYAFLFPGRYRRPDALKLAGKDCLLLLALAIPMLVIAGLIEGFVSGSGLAPVMKIALGLGTLPLVLAP